MASGEFLDTYVVNLWSKGSPVWGCLAAERVDAVPLQPRVLWLASLWRPLGLLGRWFVIVLCAWVTTQQGGPRLVRRARERSRARRFVVTPLTRQNWGPSSVNSSACKDYMQL